MVFNRLPTIYTIVEEANEEDTNQPNVIENPPVPQFNLFLHFLEFEAPYLNSNSTYCTYSTDCPNCTNSTDGSRCITMTDEYGNFYDDPLPNDALEGAYDYYISAAGYWNDPFYDLRKQATRDYEKKQTKRQKRRAAKLTKKASAIAIQEKQDTPTKHEKRHPSKKSGRRGSLGRDIVLV